MRLREVPASKWNWQRSQSNVDEAVTHTVSQVLRAVRAEGDAAVRRFTNEFDKVAEASNASYQLLVEEDKLRLAWESLDSSLQEALTAAARRIRSFHEMQRPSDVETVGQDGERLGMTWRPIARAAVYVPGGRAAYPSTVLMNVIPAQVAGVEDLILLSPPLANTGDPHPQVMAAAYAAGVRQVYRVGGAQAIAAAAYGTESIPKVDKIAGPGNIYVAIAKRQVMGDVGIDSIAGPSEVFIVADDTANPAYIAADMLAQAEHDPDAGAVCVTTEPALVAAIERELEAQLERLPKREIARQSLAKWGAVVVARSVEEAISVVNQSAPEHVELMLSDAAKWLPYVKQAGAVFLGAQTPEPVGDYYAGPNHTLPTHGSARYASGLGVADFLRRMTYVEYSPEALARHGDHITRLAEAEGLSAHAQSVRIRLDGGDTQ